jgi:hypothetical protein
MRRAAKRRQKAERQASSLDGARRRGYTWTDAELAIAAQGELSNAQVAAVTGRSYFGVRDMRMRLRRAADAAEGLCRDA